MSKKSKEQREKRKRKSALQNGMTVCRPESSNRLAWLRNAVRSGLAHSRREIAERCNAPLERLTLLLLAAPGERIDDQEDPVPLYTHDGVAVLVTPDATGRVAITSGFIHPKKADSGTEDAVATSDGQKAD
jgi:hypothetical protein